MNSCEIFDFVYRSFKLGSILFGTALTLSILALTIIKIFIDMGCRDDECITDDADINS